jgi:formylglycine-generating enzyme required for sulfatase activity
VPGDTEPRGDDRERHGCWIDAVQFRQLRDGLSRPNWADDFGRDRYGLYADFEVGGVRQRMRWLPPGRFMMGSPEDEPLRDDDEDLHEVMLSRGFWLADTACTQALWQAVMQHNPSDFEGPERPVETVSWDDAQAFIAQLNGLKSGLELRLPSEAEWEYACRAGTATPFSFGSNITPDQVNYDGNYPYANAEPGEFRGNTVSVRALPANDWGLFQMHGNVWEWCADWFANYPEKLVTIDPVGPESGGFRVLRGGRWGSGGRSVRSAYRLYNDPGYRYRGIGFRLARG